MPYVIDTYVASVNDQPNHPAMDALYESLAVATLDEAREAAWTAAGWAADAPDTMGGIHDLRRKHGGFNIHTGGTIGPLPDGTIIEVRFVRWMELGVPLGSAAHPVSEEDALAAYNRS
jgi:hypothetical protein